MGEECGGGWWGVGDPGHKGGVGWEVLLPDVVSALLHRWLRSWESARNHLITAIPLKRTTLR